MRGLTARNVSCYAAHPADADEREDDRDAVGRGKVPVIAQSQRNRRNGRTRDERTNERTDAKSVLSLSLRERWRHGFPRAP